MADPYVIFPGTTDHISTDDVNLLDADTAHLQQGLAGWDNYLASRTGSYQQAATIAPEYGDFHGQCIVEGTSGTTRLYSTASNASRTPVVADVTHSDSVYLSTDTPGRAAKCDLIYYDAAGSVLSQIQGTYSDLSVGAFTQFSVSGVAPATAELAAIRCDFQQSGGGDMAGGEVIYFDAACLREGSAPAFVPSLRIVGTLYEETLPVDMPVVFAGDGSPLTIGEGWAGNGYAYNRYDGADASAPLVCDFNAADVPVATQLPV